MALVEAVYSGKVRAVVSSMVRSSDVDDAIQEAAIKAWKLEGVECNPHALATTIARRSAINVVARHRACTVAGPKAWSNFGGFCATSMGVVSVRDYDHLEEAEEDAERKRLLGSLFSRLRADQAAAFRMRHADGMSITEIAEEMGVEYRQVATLLATAARVLRR